MKKRFLTCALLLVLAPACSGESRVASPTALDSGLVSDLEAGRFSLALSDNQVDEGGAFFAGTVTHVARQTVKLGGLETDVIVGWTPSEGVDASTQPLDFTVTEIGNIHVGKTAPNCASEEPLAGFDAVNIGLFLEQLGEGKLELCTDLLFVMDARVASPSVGMNPAVKLAFMIAREGLAGPRPLANLRPSVPLSTAAEKACEASWLCGYRSCTTTKFCPITDVTVVLAGEQSGECEISVGVGSGSGSGGLKIKGKITAEKISVNFGNRTVTGLCTPPWNPFAMCYCDAACPPTPAPSCGAASGCCDPATNCPSATCSEEEEEEEES